MYKCLITGNKNNNQTKNLITVKMEIARQLEDGALKSLKNDWNKAKKCRRSKERGGKLKKKNKEGEMKNLRSREGGGKGVETADGKEM